MLFRNVLSIGCVVGFLTSTFAGEDAGVTNLRLQSHSGVKVSQNRVFFASSEMILHVHDLTSGETRNLGVQLGVDIPIPGDSGGAPIVAKGGDIGCASFRTYPCSGLGDYFEVSGGWLVYLEAEGSLKAYDLDTGASRDLMKLGPPGSENADGGTPPLFGGRRWVTVSSKVAISAVEGECGEDLNGDGDLEDPVLLVHDLATSETTHLGVEAAVVGASGDRLLLGVYEAPLGEDLDGDGDSEDWILHVYDPRSGEWANLALRLGGVDVTLSGDLLVYSNAATSFGHPLYVRDTQSGETTVVEIEFWVSEGEIPLPALVWRVSGKWLTMIVEEHDLLRDLNQDGDTLDSVLFVHDLETRETRNLGLAASVASWDFVSYAKNRLYLDGEWLGFPADEATLRVHNLLTGATATLSSAAVVQRGLCARTDCQQYVWEELLFDLSAGIAAFSLAEGGEDLNEDGDTDDLVLHVAALSEVMGPRFLRGDSNDDGRVDISDAVATLGGLFLGQSDLPCDDAADSNDDDALDISDAVYLLNFLFLGGTVPEPPYPTCGSDPNDEELGCESFQGCG